MLEADGAKVRDVSGNTRRDVGMVRIRAGRGAP
jgi:hypothetical protein